MVQPKKKAGYACREARRPSSNKENPSEKESTGTFFTSEDGEEIEIPELPVPEARAAALASEKNLNKFWAPSEEDEAWQGSKEGT